MGTRQHVYSMSKFSEQNAFLSGCHLAEMGRLRGLVMTTLLLISVAVVTSCSSELVPEPERLAAVSSTPVEMLRRTTQSEDFFSPYMSGLIVGNEYRSEWRRLDETESLQFLESLGSIRYNTPYISVAGSRKTDGAGFVYRGELAFYQFCFTSSKERRLYFFLITEDGKDIQPAIDNPPFKFRQIFYLEPGDSPYRKKLKDCGPLINEESF